MRPLKKMNWVPVPLIPPPPSSNIWSSSGYIKIMNFCIIFSFHVSRPQFPPRLLDMVNPILWRWHNTGKCKGEWRSSEVKQGKEVYCVVEGGGVAKNVQTKYWSASSGLCFFVTLYNRPNLHLFTKCKDGRKTFILLLATYILLGELSVPLWGTVFFLVKFLPKDSIIGPKNLDLHRLWTNLLARLPTAW